jgi:hypothetical protein
MNKVDFIQAWKIWLSGGRLEQYSLWGLQILWWGRIGKTLEVIAALTIVADIVGPERLRMFGKSLAQSELREIAKRAVAEFINVFDPNSRAKVRMTISVLVAVLVGIWFFVARLIMYWAKFSPSFVWIIVTVLKLIIFALIGMITGFFTSWLVLNYAVLVLSLAAAVLALFIDYLMIKPLAWILEREEIERLIKVISVAVLLVGFHFDLLAS